MDKNISFSGMHPNGWMIDRLSFYYSCPELPGYKKMENPATPQFEYHNFAA